MRSTTAALAALLTACAVIASAPTTAFADTFCKKNEDPCAAGNSHALPFEIVALTDDAVFLFDGGSTVQCHSELVMRYTANDGPHEGVRGSLTNLTFSKCAGFCSFPEVEVLNLPYSVVARGLPQSITVKGSIRFVFKRCLLPNVNCEYSAEEALLDFKEGNPAHITAKDELLQRSGGSVFCPEFVQWDGLYRVTVPQGLLALAALP